MGRHREPPWPELCWESRPRYSPDTAPRTGQSCGRRSIPDYCAGVWELLEMQMQETKRCNKNQPICLMWGDAGLDTGCALANGSYGARAVPATPGMFISNGTQCALWILELRAASLWGSGVTPRNAEKMLIVANTKNVSGESVPRYHKWRLSSAT